MYFDTLTISAIADELRAQIVGGHVQHVVLPDKWSIGLEIYANQRRHYLFATANAQHPHIHLTGEKLRRGVETETPLLLLLRKYVRGGYLVDVEQPAWERILRLHFEHSNGATTLVVETMGRYSNIILVDIEDVILDAVKRVTPAMSRVRPILPQTSYQLPPAQDKLLPDQLTELRLLQTLEAADPTEQLWRVLLRNITGLCPLSAREVVYRVTGDPRAPVNAIERMAPLLEAVGGLFTPVKSRVWHPSVVYESRQLVAYAAYELTHYDAFTPVDSISAAVSAYYAQQVGRDAYAEARHKVQDQLDDVRERFEGQLRSLQQSMVSNDEIERLRQSGELILSYQWQIEPGQTLLEVPYEIDGAPMRIELNPSKTPVENAQAYFEKYDKAKRAGQQVPDLMAETQLQLDYLHQLATDLALAESHPDIDAVQEALADAGFIQAKRRRKPSGRSEPIRTQIDNFTVWIGRNARQNDQVTFKRAVSTDLWLHARNIPGAHVIIKRAGRQIPEKVIERAAQFAAYYSSARDDARVAVDVTEVRNVRRIKGGGPGQVLYTDERTLLVEPRSCDE